MIKVIKQRNQYIQLDSSFGEDKIMELVHRLDSIINQADVTLKNDHTSTVVVVTVGKQKWVIKRSNTKGLLHAVRRAFQTSRALHNWRNANTLKKCQILSVTPIAMVEERYGILKGRSYFICDYIHAKDALHFFACGAKPSPHWHEVSQNICEMIKKLERNQLSHRDLNLSNILIKDKQPVLIDLDAMRQYRMPFWAKRAAKKERKRFMENWQEAPNVDRFVESLFLKNLYG